MIMRFCFALSDFECLEYRRGCVTRNPCFSDQFSLVEILVPMFFDEAKIAVWSLKQQNTPLSVIAIQSFCGHRTSTKAGK